ncbi:MAG TPA: MASE1 domain-containing protein [Pyrinomonadaceae bacterium]|jgi:PAS domain S-box-containing protein
MHSIVGDGFRRSIEKPISGLLMLRPAFAAILISVGYYFGAKIGFALNFPSQPVSTLWPPNSILMAALLLTPIRWWWFMLLAALPAHLLVELQSGIPTAMVICWFVSNCSEAIIGAAVLRYLSDGSFRFDSIRQVATFLFAVLLATFLSSFLDAGFVVLNGWGTSSYSQVWRMRFFSNVLAELTLVPIIVMWVTDGVSSFRGLSRWRWLEAVGLAIGLLTVSVGAFSWRRAAHNTPPALLYTPLPILLWAAVRFGPKGVNTGLAVVAFLAIWTATHGLGPFSVYSPEDNALSIQLFLILISMPLMFLAAVIQERGQARQEARQSADRLGMALSAAQMGTWDWHIADSATTWSDETKRMFGLSPTDSEKPPEVFYSMMHPGDRSMVEHAINRSLKDGSPYEAEFRMRQPDGSIRWIRSKGKVLLDDAGKPMRFLGINADITTRKEAEGKLLESNRQVRALAGRLISAQEAERRRLSHELHDDLSQKVATLSVAISRLKRQLPAATQQIAGQLDQLYKETNDLGQDIRQLSHELHPASLEHLGLAEALAAYLIEFEKDEGLATKFTSRIKSETFPFEVSVCLYRIGVEALRNIAKHAHAESVSVLLEEDEQTVRIEVADSGVGFDVEAAKRGSGLGLISADERVHLLQGSFEINSIRGKGTILIAKIPIK